MNPRPGEIREVSGQQKTAAFSHIWPWGKRNPEQSKTRFYPLKGGEGVGEGFGHRGTVALRLERSLLTLIFSFSSAERGKHSPQKGYEVKPK